ncbi:hypothetical protein DHD32_08030 [Arenibacter sp. TNZ]|jgi:hypothetical protein|uniref:2TM domain-containing protein n=1 Tax=Arenibacter TaxID=178469 RepID=UPI000CD45EAD|nr:MULTISPECIES: 2TM domain-containing protein [Arenibacter]MCM4171425.1 hypothetical protein [Arenibacter sp. TNZ]
MEIMDLEKDKKLERARKQVKELKGFYVHLSVYLAVNLLITIVEITEKMGRGETFFEAFRDFGTFAIWLFWGIGLVFHGLKVFSCSPFFNKEWEARQIQKYMDKEKRESEKYK